MTTFPFDRAPQLTQSMPRTARFVIVGLLGTLLDITLFTVLHVVLGVPALAANTISYTAGSVNNYILHRNWTFANRSHKAVLGQSVQFAAASLTALLLNNLLVIYLTPVLGLWIADSGMAALAAKLCATGVGVIWNYVVNTVWVFGEASKRGTD